jgi:hypothetical protein
MKEYIVVPPGDVAKPAALKKWVELARGYAATLPTKEKAKAKERAPKGGRGEAPAKKQRS